MGNVDQLSQGVGGLIIKGQCPACDVLAQDLLSKPDKAFIETVVGRGWLLWVSGVDPVIIIADAATSTAKKYIIKPPHNNPLQAAPPQSRGTKTYEASPATCGVESEQSKAVFGWVEAPVLKDRSSGAT